MNTLYEKFEEIPGLFPRDSLTALLDKQASFTKQELMDLIHDHASEINEAKKPYPIPHGCRPILR